MRRKLIYLHLFIMLIHGPVWSETIVSVQGSAVYTSYNDVRLPGDSGSNFSYKDDVDAGIGYSPRVEAGYEFDFPVYIGLMASTLRLEGEGTLDRDIVFDNKTFNKGERVRGTYRFDSYRATARYYFFENKKFRIGAGLTGKIRDAEITLESDGKKGGLKNTGFVPLLNFYGHYNLNDSVRLLFYGDGAWSPYGRAEDFFFGGLYEFMDGVSVMTGYRILEGGADNDTVYTFSMFHYAVLGVELRF